MTVDKKITGNIIHQSAHSRFKKISVTHCEELESEYKKVSAGMGVGRVIKFDTDEFGSDYKNAAIAFADAIYFACGRKPNG